MAEMRALRDHYEMGGKATEELAEFLGGNVVLLKNLAEAEFRRRDHLALQEQKDSSIRQAEAAERAAVAAERQALAAERTAEATDRYTKLTRNLLIVSASAVVISLLSVVVSLLRH